LNGIVNGAPYFCQRTSFVSTATKSTKARKRPPTARSGFSAKPALAGTTPTAKRPTEPSRKSQSPQSTNVGSANQESPLIWKYSAPRLLISQPLSRPPRVRKSKLSQSVRLSPPLTNMDTSQPAPQLNCFKRNLKDLKSPRSNILLRLPSPSNSLINLLPLPKWLLQ